jgi:hypothetical protein
MDRVSDTCDHDDAVMDFRVWLEARRLTEGWSMKAATDNYLKFEISVNNDKEARRDEYLVLPFVHTPCVLLLSLT